ncbi:Uncharacterized protein FWK35_00033503 [Aphis craccivora]|uniref:Uncharacterized protein n=1 Tax=Aphis craccivora TaxID=307492 RepID=A0A6G0VMB7_APHCR|nr:Uncharacterized protein FWK35_00033503 [Aphis craccivora]
MLNLKNNSERSEECIDFTMIITSRNNAPISNYEGGFRCKSEYPWCIIEVKSEHLPTVFKKIEKHKKKITEKQQFLRKTSFRPNRFFFLWFSNIDYLRVENLIQELKFWCYQAIKT